MADEKIKTITKEQSDRDIAEASVENMKTAENTIDKSAVFNKKVMEKVKEIQGLCNSYKIPFFMAFGVRTDDKGRFITERVYSILPEMFEEQMVIDHRFADLVNIAGGGFQAVPITPTDEDNISNEGFSNEEEDAIDMLTDSTFLPPH